MNPRHIKAIFWRHVWPLKRDAYRYIDFFYWPLFDLMVWGYLSIWVQSTQGAAINITLLTMLIGWQIINRAHMEIAYSFMQEMDSRSVVALFATPLSVNEWLAATMLVGFIKGFLIFLFGIVIVWLMFGLSPLLMFIHLLPYFPLLLLSGWIFGLLTLAILVRFGQSAQSSIWVIGWCAVPFSGIFYPITVLPQWAQYISAALPTTQIFSQIREFVQTQNISLQSLGINLGLNIITWLVAYTLFYLMFKKKKEMGLAQLDIE